MQKDTPKFSIVIPSFNQGNFIERSIKSVINQHYPNVEIIIIDGGSTDDTIDVIKKYETYITYWVSENDNGQSDALNKGFNKATGDIYGWLNADDTYCGSAFHIACNAIRTEGKKIVFGDYFEIDEKDNVIQRQFAFDFNLSHFIYEGFHLNAQAMFWKREVHDRFGEFNVLLHRTMDYDMILRFGRNEGSKAFRRIASPLANFRRHPSQKTNGFDDTVIKEHLAIAISNGIVDKYKLSGKFKRTFFRLRRAYWYVKRGGVLFLFKTVFK